MNHYNKDRDNIALGKWYTDHVSAMTREGLHAKSDIASELAFRDKQIAERDETIRKLRDPVAVHVAMLRGEIAVPPLAELLHVYGATFSGLDVANVEIAKARAEAAKWERLHDELYAEIASEHRRDEYGETETAAECVGRIIRERDELRAQLDEYERAPTFTYMYRFPHMGGFVWRHSSSDFNGARPVESIELIARPAKEST